MVAAVLTVSDFSRITHLSVKTLRHYHHVGLLEPARVNTATGYRYYSVEQIPAAQVIRRLRDLQMPVADVKAVLTASDASARNALITAHLGKLETELAQTRDAVDSLRKLLQHPENATGIQRRSVPETTAAAVGQVVDRADVFAWWEGALGELHATVRAQGLAVTGPAGALFASELFQHDRGEVTVFIPADRAVRAIGRVVPAVIPGAELAVITHCGALSGADISYGTLGAYAMAHEISVDGPVREYYLRGPHDTPDPAAWMTEIGWPIFRADRAA
jgi:DNA-binding transcriptional MerR regulator/effector-binding domain-containing protein